MNMTKSTIVRSLLFCAAAFAPAQALAQSMWIPAQGQAKAFMPVPDPGSRFTAGSLACDAQIWTMTLETDDPASIQAADGGVVLSFPRGDHEAESAAAPGAVLITVPHGALEPLMSSSRLTIRFAGGIDEVRFNLTGSRRAIGAAQALCTPREMPGANSVALTPYSSYLELARALRKDDIADFQLSTAANPTLRAGMVEIDADHRLLFAELCGSTWYYGQSGCGLMGFAAVPGADQSKPEGWKPVYESEGVFLFVDPTASNDGWPVLVSIPLKEGFEETRWAWDGEAYAVQDAVAPTPESVESEGSEE